MTISRRGRSRRRGFDMHCSLLQRMGKLSRLMTRAAYDHSKRRSLEYISTRTRAIDERVLTRWEQTTDFSRVER
jgi:hypothetical protein